MCVLGALILNCDVSSIVYTSMEVDGVSSVWRVVLIPLHKTIQILGDWDPFDSGGMSCQLIHYTHEEHDTFFKSLGFLVTRGCGLKSKVGHKPPREGTDFAAAKDKATSHDLKPLKR